MTDEDREDCPFCAGVQHRVAQVGSMRILECPATPPGELWSVDTRYVKSRPRAPYVDSFLARHIWYATRRVQC